MIDKSELKGAVQRKVSEIVSHIDYPFEFPVGMDRAEVIDSHRRRDDCMHCGFEPPMQCRSEFSGDMDKPIRRDALIRAIDERRGAERLNYEERFSAGFILEQAAHRHFMVLEHAQAQLKGWFSEADFQVILDAECSAVWQWDPQMSVAAMVGDHNGVRKLKDLAEDSSLRQLLEKLLALTPLEDATLVDACERVWRGYDNPLL